MLTEKPSWVRHEGLQIFSIDIQPGGLRFATGGGDQKVDSFFLFCSKFFCVILALQTGNFRLGCAKLRFLIQP